jgi:hypothetical protein
MCIGTQISPVSLSYSLSLLALPPGAKAMQLPNVPGLSQARRDNLKVTTPESPDQESADRLVASDCTRRVTLEFQALASGGRGARPPRFAELQLHLP